MAAVQPPADALQLRRVIDRNNLTLRLSDLLIASTAAPAFFPPVVLRVGDEDKEFGDGGVTAHNNPALQMVLTATLPVYHVQWATGPD